MIPALIPATWALGWLALAVLLEVGGNILLKLSHGLSRRTMGGLGLAMVMAAFAALAQAIRGMDVSTAYAVWGGAGLVITAVIGAVLFGQRIRPTGWAGIVLVLLGVVALKLF